jgi:hypothetical protein
MSLVTFPEASQGVIYSNLNYSVILQWVTTMSPEPMLSWTLDGRLCGAGEKLFIHQLSLEQLGMYRCTAPNSEEQLVSEPVMVSLPREIPFPIPKTSALSQVCHRATSARRFVAKMSSHLPSTWRAEAC